jgi:hypothetical protein
LRKRWQDLSNDAFKKRNDAQPPPSSINSIPSRAFAQEICQEPTCLRSRPPAPELQPHLASVSRTQRMVPRRGRSSPSHPMQVGCRHAPPRIDRRAKQPAEKLKTIGTEPAVPPVGRCRQVALCPGYSDQIPIIYVYMFIGSVVLTMQIPSASSRATTGD